MKIYEINYSISKANTSSLSSHSLIAFVMFVAVTLSLLLPEHFSFTHIIHKQHSFVQHPLSNSICSANKLRFTCIIKHEIVYVMCYRSVSVCIKLHICPDKTAHKLIGSRKSFWCLDVTFYDLFRTWFVINFAEHMIHIHAVLYIQYIKSMNSIPLRDKAGTNQIPTFIKT